MINNFWAPIKKMPSNDNFSILNIYKYLVNIYQFFLNFKIIYICIKTIYGKELSLIKINIFN